jgi:carbon starvation protein CstA
MFEALFILTTIDTGTRIAILLQEVGGKVIPSWPERLVARRDRQHALICSVGLFINASVRAIWGCSASPTRCWR